MSEFENFVNLELPRRSALLTNAITSYDGDPNGFGVPAIISGAPVGTWFLWESQDSFWRKNAAGTYIEMADGSGGGSVSPANQVWVDKNGDNSTGEIGDRDKPFFSIDDAITAVENASLTNGTTFIIWVGQGTYLDEISWSLNDRNLAICGAYPSNGESPAATLGGSVSISSDVSAHGYVSFVNLSIEQSFSKTFDISNSDSVVQFNSCRISPANGEIHGQVTFWSSYFVKMPFGPTVCKNGSSLAVHGGAFYDPSSMVVFEGSASLTYISLPIANIPATDGAPYVDADTRKVITTAGIQAGDPTEDADVVNLGYLEEFRIVSSDRTYYVDYDNGDDSNDGLTSGTAWKTIEHMTEVINELTINGCIVTVEFAEGDHPLPALSGASLWHYPRPRLLGNAGLRLEGDNRIFAGLSLSHDCITYDFWGGVGGIGIISLSGTVSGSSSSGHSEVSVSTSSEGTMTATQPDLSASGIVAGDKLAVTIGSDKFYADVVQVRGTDVIELDETSWVDIDGASVAEPVLGDVNTHGSSICLIPNRRLYSTATFPESELSYAIVMSGYMGARALHGFHIDLSGITTGSYSVYGIYANALIYDRAVDIDEHDDGPLQNLFISIQAERSYPIYVTGNSTVYCLDITVHMTGDGVGFYLSSDTAYFYLCTVHGDITLTNTGIDAGSSASYAYWLACNSLSIEDNGYYISAQYAVCFYCSSLLNRDQDGFDIQGAGKVILRECYGTAGSAQWALTIRKCNSVEVGYTYQDAARIRRNKFVASGGSAVYTRYNNGLIQFLTANLEVGTNGYGITSVNHTNVRVANSVNIAPKAGATNTSAFFADDGSRFIIESPTITTDNVAPSDILNRYGNKGSIVLVDEVDADSVPYTPSVAADWDGTAPVTLQEAVDRCAALLKALNGGTGP